MELKIKIKQLLNYPVNWTIANYNALMKKKRIIHVYSDSHGNVFLNTNTFLVHPIESATAYNLSNETSTTRAGPKLFNELKRASRNDIIMLVFGEIDCRIHIYGQSIKQKKSLKVIVTDVVEKYGVFIEKIRAKGYKKIIVCSTPAASLQENAYHYPNYANKKTRAKITKLFNQTLQNYCKKNDLAYLDVYTPSKDLFGMLKKDYRSDEIHLNKKILPIVEKQLQKILLYYN